VFSRLVTPIRCHWIAACALLVALPVLAGVTLAARDVRSRERVVSVELQGLHQIELLQSVFPSMAAEPLLQTMVQISDTSGLTFDSQTTGIDYSDALAYRLPPAIDRMLTAVLRLRGAAERGTLSLSDRLAMTGARVEAASLARFAYDDLHDALTHDRIPNATLASRLAHSESSLAAAETSIGSVALSSQFSSSQSWVAVERSQRATSDLESLLATIGPVLGNELQTRSDALGVEFRTIVAGGIATVLGILVLGFAVDYLNAVRHREQLAALAHKASHDDLTGLLNRAAFMDELRVRLTGGGTQSVFFVDLNRFKQVNDRYGHDCGDTLLLTVAQRLRNHFDGGALLGRYGGDEFAIALPEQDDVNAHRVSTEVSDVIARPVDLGSVTICIESSIGIAVARDSNVGDVLRRADQSMYRAKRSGRLRIV
jgi:diguanylate cyclase (GGDEF)-like protein